MKLANPNWAVALLWALVPVAAACNVVQSWGTLVILSGGDPQAGLCLFGVWTAILTTLTIVGVIALCVGASALGLKEVAVARALLAVDAVCLTAWFLGDGLGRAGCIIGI